MPSTARSDLAVYEAMRRALKQHFDQPFPPSKDEALAKVVPPLSNLRWALGGEWDDWVRARDSIRNSAVMCGNG